MITRRGLVLDKPAHSPAKRRSPAPSPPPHPIAIANANQQAKAKCRSKSLIALWAKADAHTPKSDVGPVDFDPITNSQEIGSSR